MNETIYTGVFAACNIIPVAFPPKPEGNRNLISKAGKQDNCLLTFFTNKNLSAVPRHLRSGPPKIFPLVLPYSTCSNKFICEEYHLQCNIILIIDASNASLIYRVIGKSCKIFELYNSRAEHGKIMLLNPKTCQ